MQVILSGFETDILNKFVHTDTFSELNDLQEALYDNLNADKDAIIASGVTNGMDFNLFASQTVDRIIQFLLGHEFYHSREGGVYFLTEKGKHLKAQGSLQKYQVWEKERDNILIEEMHTIQKKGYLEREQPLPAELTPQRVDEEKKSNFLYYILIIVAIIVACAIGKYHKF